VKTKWIKFRRKSEVFKDADQMQDLQKEEVFGVYYEENGEDLRISRKTTKQQKKIMRSSVNDQFVYRGFSKREIGTIQRLSQGYQEDANLRKSTMRRSSGNYLNDSIILSEESSSDVSEPEFGSKEQSERVSKKGKRKFDQSEFNKVIKTPRVVFNPKDQSSTSKSSAKSVNESEHDEDGSEPSEFPSSEDEGESESVETERKETLNSNSEMSSHI
jgi:cobalamin biosynthesis Mg chelatase CobN